MSRGEASSKPRRKGRIAAHPLLAGLLLAVALAPCQLRAQTNTAKALPPANRWLLIVETSRSMQLRADAVLQTVQELLNSGLNGQLRRGDTLGIWTFNEDLYAGRFPLQTWSPEAQRDILSRTLAFVQAEKYERQANFGQVLPALDRVIKGSALITVILISSGDDRMRGTPFDNRINEFYQKWHDQQEQARMPFVTVLRAKAGQLADYTVNTPPWPTQMPRLSQETRSAETLQSKLLEALRNTPSPTSPPPIISGKQTLAEETRSAETLQSKLLEALHNALSPTSPPPIISGKQTPAEAAPAPKPRPPGVTVDAPVPAPVATSTNRSVTANPPVLAVSPVEMAKSEAAPVMPDKPSAELPPKPSPAPGPVTELKAEIVKEPGRKPTEPAPATAEAVAALPTPAPPTAREVSPGASSTATVTQAVPTLPSAIPAPPTPIATAVPGETLAWHRTIWIAVLVLAGVVVSFAFLRLRRRRAAPGASLITRSFERKHKP